MTLHHPHTHTRRRVAMLVAAAMLAVVGCTADDNGTGIAPLPDDIAPVTDDEPEPEPEAEVAADPEPEPEPDPADDARDEIETLVRTHLDLLDAYEAGDLEFDDATVLLTGMALSHAERVWIPDPTLEAGARLIYDFDIDLADDLSRADLTVCVNDRRRASIHGEPYPYGLFHELRVATIPDDDGGWLISSFADPLMPREPVRNYTLCAPDIYVQQAIEAAAQTMADFLDDLTVANAPDFGVDHRFRSGTAPYEEGFYRRWTEGWREGNVEYDNHSSYEYHYTVEWVAQEYTAANQIAVDLCMYEVRRDLFALADDTHEYWRDEPDSVTYRFYAVRGPTPGFDGLHPDEWLIAGVSVVDGLTCTAPLEEYDGHYNAPIPDTGRHPDATTFPFPPA